jgi:Na+-driven multidrug efflux pump
MNWLRKLFKPIDLTEGKPYKAILAFMLPIFLSMAFQQIYSLIDAMIVGQTIPLQFAGVSDCSSLIYLILQFAYGCAAGFSVITSSRFGAKDGKGAAESAAVSIILSVFISLALTAVGVGCYRYLLAWINVTPETDAVTYEAASIYLITIYSGIIATMLFNVGTGILRSIGDSVAPLAFLVISSLLNIALDFLFVLTFPTPALKVFGAGFATILSQAISAVLTFVYAYRRYPALRMRFADLENIRWRFYFEHLKQGLPLAFNFSILAIGVVVMQGAVNSFDVGVALEDGSPAHYAQDGYGAACKILSFAFAFYNALGTAMLTFTASNFGARKWSRIKQGSNQSLLILLFGDIIAKLFLYLLCINGAFLYIFLSPSQVYEETIDAGVTYLYTILPFTYAVGALVMWRNVIQGLEKPLFPFLAGIIELAARLLACLYLPLAVAESYRYIAVCSADSLAWVLGALFLLIGLIHYVYSGRFLPKEDGAPLLKKGGGEEAHD